jgi:benzoyl-CoA reductase/2-hydroxyglutaryl-CoA dehydratase subunit BcrC/BadD/HgdB
MSLGGSLLYHWNVNILGRVALRANRLAAEWRAKTNPTWKSEVLTPPLKISPWTKELIGRHYLRGRYANKHSKVAWVTSGAPIEFLKALDFYVLYPENHGALCGTMRIVEEIASRAENAGYSRDICSYARTDIGAVLSGITPVGKLPKPDLLLACTNICQTVLHWYRVLAHYFRAPLILIDTPFIYKQVSEHAVDFVKCQIEAAIHQAEGVAGKTMQPQRLEEAARLSLQAAHLWMEIVDRGRQRPSPISVFDQFIHMAPVVEMRGEAGTVDFYAAMLKEVDERVDQGVGVVMDERARLLWDNIPIWYRLRYLAEYLGRYGIAIVASTYTRAWGELASQMDHRNPVEGMARTYLHPILNRGVGDKLATMKGMINDFHLDGAILHSDRSCKPYSIGQIDERDRLIQECGIPALLLEADHNDPRSYSEDQVANRLDAFIEMLGV